MIKLKDIILNELALHPGMDDAGSYTTDLKNTPVNPLTGSDHEEILPTASVKVTEFTRNGLKIYAAYAFNQSAKAPEGFKTALRKAVKDINAGNNTKLMEELIDRKIKYMKNAKMLDDINVIIPLGSTSKLNSLITKQFSKYIPNALILDNLLTKVKWKDVKIVDKGESSKKGYEMAKKRLDHMQKHHPDDYFEIKKTGATQSIRRYFSMFYQVAPGYNIDLLKKLPGSNILLVDDTLEEGVTINEAHRVIDAFLPNKVRAFVFLSGN